MFFLLDGSVSGSRQYAYTVEIVFKCLILLGYGLGFLNHLFMGGTVGFTSSGLGCLWVFFLAQWQCGIYRLWVGFFMSVLSCGWQCLGESAVCLHCCESL